MSDLNRVIIAAWDTVLYEKFCRFRHLLVEGLSRHSDAAFDRCRHPEGSRVLDVGCGFGDSTLRIARQVGPSGEAVGVDCANSFVRAATADARRQGASNAHFAVVDVQDGDLQGPYDHAFARFGTMFFSSPVVAMRNVRNALKPGGAFTQIVWRRREENPWLYDAETAVKKLLPVVSRDDQLHCGPGPFSLASADAASGILRGAGFERIAFERFDCDICIGRHLDEAVEFAMALGPAGEAIRLAGDEGGKRRPEVIAALRDALEPYAGAEGVWAPSSTWIITAVNPG